MVTLYRVLKPGGVVLATMPGIIPVRPEEWPFFWSLTAVASERVFEECFPPTAIEVESHGNGLAAISFLHSLASDELTRDEPDHNDPSYPVVIAVRAVEPKESAG
jgi:hypothetical protein